MATKAKIAKAKKREELVAKYAELRVQLKAQGDYQALAKLPRDASPVRLHNRDSLDGRARGYLREFGLSRINFRKLALAGKIPGVKKASW